MPHDNTRVKAKFHRPIVIEPNVKYEIQLQLEHVSGYNRSVLRDIVAEGETFASLGVIHRLYFSVFDKWSIQTANLFFRLSESRSKILLIKIFLMKLQIGILKFFDLLNFLTLLIL